MALVPIRIDRTSKPPVGTPLRSDGHWGVQALIGCWPLNEASGISPLNVASNKPCLLQSGQWTPPGVKFGSATANGINCGIVSLFGGTSPVSVIASHNFVSASAAHTLYSYSTELVLRHSTTAGGPEFILNSFTANDRVTSAGYIAGISNVYAGTYGPSGKLRAYCNGALGGEVTPTGSYAAAGASHYIGGYGALAGANGVTDFVLLFARELSSGEVASLSANPWQIFEPEVVWVEVGGSIPPISAAIAILQAAQSQGASGSLLFSAAGAINQQTQQQTTTGKLAFNGASTTTQQPQTSAFSALLAFRATTAEMQAANLTAVAASLAFRGSASQIQQAQQQSIFQSLQAISGAIAQTQAAQIASLTASLIFGGNGAQTQATQADALVAVLRFSGATDQAQTAQEQAIVAILGAVAISGTISQEQAVQLATLSAVLKFSAAVEQSQAAQTQILREFISAIITGYGIPVSVSMPQPLRVSAPLPQHSSISVALRLPPASVTAGLV